jgi:hypothetical protein
VSGEVIKSYLVKLGFDVDAKGVGAFKSTLSGTAFGLAGLATAAAAAGTAVLAFTSHVANEIDKIGDLSEMTGIAAETIEKFGFAAEQSDSSLSAVMSSFQGLSRIMGEASLGIGRGAMTFKKLQLSAKKSNGELKTTEEMMTDIGKLLQGKSLQEQLAIMTKLGIDPSLRKTLMQDNTKLFTEFAQIERVLGVNSEMSTQRSGEFVDTFARLHQVAKKVWEAIAVKLMPGFTRGAKQFTDSLLDNLPKITKHVMFLVNTLVGMINMLVKIGAGSVRVLTMMDTATNGVTTAVIALGVAFKLLSMSPILAGVTLVLAAMTLLYDDYTAFVEGRPAFLDWEAIIAWVDKIVLAFVVLGTAIKEAFMGGWEFAKGMIKLLSRDFSGAMENFSAGAERFSGAKSKAYDAGKAQYASTTINHTSTTNVNGAGDPVAVARNVTNGQSKVVAEQVRFGQSLVQ